MKTSFPKDKIKVLLLEGVHEVSVENFKKNGYENVELIQTALNADELKEVLPTVHIIGIRSKTKLTKEVLQHADKLMAIACFCIGTNQVDLEYAAQKGITVFNSPYSNTRSVAELVLAECVMLVRRIPHRSHAAHEGQWIKSAVDSFELRGKTLGIIGYGHIGSQVSVLAEAFGMKVLYYDIETKLPLGNANAVDSMDELLASSQIVTLHVPATPETVNMIRAEHFAKMKAGSFFLNLSRGNVVDIDALKAALESGHLKGAAVDVYPQEPKSNNEAFTSPLQGLPNVILTPHIGGSTQEAQENIGKDASMKLVNYLDTGSSSGSCTTPPLSLPTQNDTHRILHIHKNVPGVLSAINTKMAELNVNILGQYLKTNEHVGYVVLDVDKNVSEQALEAVQGIENTLKARILY